MKTTLEEARKALLRALDISSDHLSMRRYGNLQLVQDYLDNQVPLAVENEQLRARLAHAESFMNTTNALPSQQDTLAAHVHKGPYLDPTKVHNFTSSPEGHMKIGRALRGGVYGKFAEPIAGTAYDEKMQNAKAHAEDIDEAIKLGFKSCPPMFTMKIAKDSSLGKAITEASDNGTKMGDLMRVIRDSKCNINQMYGKMGAAPAGPQITASTEEILKDCNEIIASYMGIPRHCLGGEFSNERIGELTKPDPAKEAAEITRRTRLNEICARIESKTGERPLHWCVTADCNCNACVKERGYIV